MQDSLQ